MIVEWFYRENTENTAENRTRCNTGGEIKQDLVEQVSECALLIFISLRGVVIFFFFSAR